MFRGYWRVGIIARWFLKPVRPMIYMQMREPNPVWSGGPRTRTRCPVGRMAKGGPEASVRIGTIKSAPAWTSSGAASARTARLFAEIRNATRTLDRACSTRELIFRHNDAFTLAFFCTSFKSSDSSHLIAGKGRLKLKIMRAATRYYLFHDFHVFHKLRNSSALCKMQEAVFIIFVNIVVESKSEIYKNSFKLRWNKHRVN